jgi:DNA-binding SARP family transcriptional activator
MQAVNHLGRHYEASSQWQQAIDCYGKGLETEELTEAFYQQLIVCYLQLELPAEALQVYSRCERVFQRELGIEPSAKTKMLLRDYRDTDKAF